MANIRRALVIAFLRRNVLLIIAVAAIAIMVVLTINLVQPVLAVPEQPDQAAPALVAGLALIGVLFTGFVALVGHILKIAIDARTLRLAEQNEQRAAVDSERLRIQAATETVKLFSTGQGEAAPPLQVSAALIVLAKLDELQLALDLAAECWPKAQITASAALSLCDAAFATTDTTAHRSAAMLILNNWEQLQIDDNQVHWLSTRDEWPEGLEEEAREILRLAISRWVAKIPAVAAGDFRTRLLANSTKVGDPRRLGTSIAIKSSF